MGELVTMGDNISRQVQYGRKNISHLDFRLLAQTKTLWALLLWHYSLGGNDFD